MKKIRVYATLTSVNAEADMILDDIPDDATTEQINDIAEEAAQELYSWNWEYVEE